MNAMSLQDLPPWGLGLLGVLVLVQLALDVWALTDLYRRPVDRLTMPRKWVWAAIILLVSTFGAIIYLLAGRRPAPAVDMAPGVPAAERAESAADALYGAPKGIDPR